MATDEATDFRTLLADWGLSKYEDKFDDDGWDDPNAWHEITNDILQNDLGFKKGHISKFVKKRAAYFESKNQSSASKPNPSIHSGKGVPHKCNEMPKESYESKKETKNIVLVGGTGAGKTSTINSAVHYLFNSIYEQPRTYLIKEKEKSGGQAVSQTDTATIYRLAPYSDDVKYIVSLVDTPGFGDTRNENDEKLTDSGHVRSIDKCFTQIENIDAIVFVVKSSANRVTQELKYVFTKVMSLFGKDIENNIFIVFTFTDFEPPPALDALKKCEIPCNKYYLVNNGVFSDKYKTPTNPNKAMGDRVSYLQTIEQLKKLFEDIGKTKQVSLHNTHKVIKDRKQLGYVLEEIPKKVPPILDVVSSINKTIKLFKKRDNINFDHIADLEFSIVEPHIYQENTEQWCLNNNDKSVTCCEGCYAVSPFWCQRRKSGYCVMCLDEHDSHVYQHQKWIHTTKVVKTTANKYLAKYKNVKSKKLIFEKVFAALDKQKNGQKHKLEEKFVYLVWCCNRLNKLALKADIETPENYIDAMIKNERKDKKNGYEDRIEELERLKHFEKENQEDFKNHYARIELVWGSDKDGWFYKQIKKVWNSTPAK